MCVCTVCIYLLAGSDDPDSSQRECLALKHHDTVGPAVVVQQRHAVTHIKHMITLLNFCIAVTHIFVNGSWLVVHGKMECKNELQLNVLLVVHLGKCQASRRLKFTFLENVCVVSVGVLSMCSIYKMKICFLFALREKPLLIWQTDPKVLVWVQPVNILTHQRQNLFKLLVSSPSFHQTANPL